MTAEREPRTTPDENKELLLRLDAWHGREDEPGPLIRWAAAHLRGCIPLDEAREQAAAEARRGLLDVDVLAVAMWNTSAVAGGPFATTAEWAIAIAAEYRRLIEAPSASTEEPK